MNDRWHCNDWLVGIVFETHGSLVVPVPGEYRPTFEFIERKIDRPPGLS